MRAVLIEIQFLVFSLVLLTLAHSDIPVRNFSVWPRGSSLEEDLISIYFLPALAVSFLTLLSAVFAGWRPFRRCRRPGIAVNTAAAVWYLFLLWSVSQLSWTNIIPAAYYFLNIFFLALLPLRPSAAVLRRAAAGMQIAVMLVLAWVIFVILPRYPSPLYSPYRPAGSSAVLLLIWVLCILPLIFNYHAVSVIAFIPYGAFWSRLVLSGAVTAAVLVYAPALGILLAAGTLALLILAECTILYPQITPPAESLWYRAASLLGGPGPGADQQAP